MKQEPEPFVATYAADPRRLVVVNGSDMYDVSRTDLAKAYLSWINARPKSERTDDETHRLEHTEN